MKTPDEQTDFLNSGSAFEEAILSNHDRDVVAGMKRLRLIRDADHANVLELPSRFPAPLSGVDD